MKNTKNSKTNKNEKALESASDSEANSLRESIVEEENSIYEGVTQKSRGGKKRRAVKSISDSSIDGEGSSTLAPAATTLKKSFGEFLRPRQKTARINDGIDIEELAQSAAESRAALSRLNLNDDDTRTATALNNQVLDDVGIILTVASKSRNLKGTFQRALKDAAASIKVVFEALHQRSSTEETKALQLENSRLQNEMEELRKELAEVRKAVAKENTSIPSQITPSTAVLAPLQFDELTRSIMVKVGGMMDAKLKGLEERLLPERRIRPPLAADKRNQVLNQETTDLWPASQSNHRKGNTKTNELTIQENSERVLENAQAAEGRLEKRNSWSMVVKRGGKMKTIPANDVAAKKQVDKATKIKLRSPRSTAVVITLQPGAHEKTSYAKILSEAKDKIKLSSLGVPALRFRQSATGGRIIEVPGATSGDVADSLATKLRELLPAELVKVSRPTKCADLRVIGLDDSVTETEVVAAVADQGGCLADTVKVGEIRRTPTSLGTLWVRCPISAAKKLELEGRLLVGWVSAHIKLLPPRPMRCYRCLEGGHVKAQCNAEVDRSDQCFRCGQLGHKAKACSSAPNCSICATENRPAKHLLGSGECASLKRKSTKIYDAAVNIIPAARTEEEDMVTDQNG